MAILGSDTGRLPRRGEADQLEQASRPVDVRVLVEDPFAGPAAKLLGLAGVVQQRAVRLDRLVRARDQQHLALRLEPALDPSVRAGDDRRSRGRALERPRRRRARNLRVRAARDVEADPARGDGSAEAVERDPAELARPAKLTPEVATADREVHLGQPLARLRAALAGRLP